MSITIYQPAIAQVKDDQKADITFSKNNTTVTIKGLNSSQSNKSDSDYTQSIIGAVTAGVAIAALLIGLKTSLKTFGETQLLRKKEIMKDIISPLIRDYHSEELKKAKDIMNGSSILGDNSIYNRSKLPEILRDSTSEPNKLKTPITDSEREIRDSFDAFFRFLVKLEYHVFIGLLSNDEITYFQSFIDKAASEPSVVNYMKFKGFPLRGLLHSLFTS